MIWRVNGGRLLWLVAAAAGFGGVFFGAYHMPAGTPGISASWMEGYSNQWARAFFALALGLCTLACGLGEHGCRRAAKALQWVRESPSPLPPWREGRVLYACLFLLLAVHLSILLGWYVLMPEVRYAEACYFTDRIDLLFLGRRPYVDFQYGYGVLLLYIPYWLQAATRGWIGYECAYVATLAGCFAFGLLALLVVVDHLQLTMRQKGTVLLLTGLSFLTLDFGLQYTPLRYLLVPAYLFILHGAQLVHARGPKAAHLVRFAAVAAGGLALAFGFSPEMGFAALGGACVYCVWLWRDGARACAYAGAAALLAGLLALTSMGLISTATIGFFLQGAQDFPLVPNAITLWVMGLAFLLLPVLVVAVLQSGGGPAALLAALTAITGLLVVPAFGRADPGHVAFNLMPLLLLGFAAAAARPTPLLPSFRAYAWGYGILFVLLLILSGIGTGWGFYQGILARSAAGPWVDRIPAGRLLAAAELAAGEAGARLIGDSRRKWADGLAQNWTRQPQLVASWQAAWRRDQESGSAFHDVSWCKTIPPPSDLDALVAFGRMGVPFGAEMDVDRYLKVTGRYVPGFFPSMDQITQPRQTRQKLADIAKCDVLLVPSLIWTNAATATVCPLQGPPQFDAWRSVLFLYPIRVHVKRAPYAPEQEIVALLRREYDQVASWRTYAILRRKVRAPPAASLPFAPAEANAPRSPH